MQSSAHEQMNKIDIDIHLDIQRMIGYFSAIERKEILMLTTTLCQLYNSYKRTNTQVRFLEQCSAKGMLALFNQ